MRYAVVIAPSLPATSEGGPASLAVPGVREGLARCGFKPLVVPPGGDLAARVAKVVAPVGEEDALVVYIAGPTRLDGDDVVVRIGAEAGVETPIRALGDVVADRSPASVLFIVEALHDGVADDAMLAAEHIDAIVRALGARARGFSVLVAARAYAASLSAPSVWPFTRYILRAVEDPSLRDDEGATLVSRVYDAVRAVPELNTFVQSYALVAGKNDFELPSTPYVSIPPPPPEPSPGPPSSEPVSSLTPILEGANAARDRRDWDGALDAYKKALMLVAADDVGARATIYADIGEVKLAQGKGREAELNFEKALKSAPTHRRSIEMLVQLATEAKEWRRVVEWRTKLAASYESPGARAKELVRLADVIERDLSDPRAAAEELERAVELVPNDAVILERLRALYEKLGRWPKVIDALGALVEVEPAGRARAERRFAQADIALGRLRDEERGIFLLEGALDEDPTFDKAAQTLVAVRTARQEWSTLDKLYTKLVDRFAQAGDKERAWDACRKLGALRRDRLRDGAGALEAFTGAIRCKPSDVDTRAMLAELYLAKSDEASAVVEFTTIAANAPTRASTFARLFGLHVRAGRVDRAWLCSQALVELDAADIDHQILFDQYKTDGPIRPRASLDDAAWDAWLRAPGADEVVTGVLGAIAPAAVKMRVAELRAKRELVALDPAKRQPPTSTASAVRSCVWASQVLGVPVPDVYVLESVPGGIVAVPAETPSTALGPEVTRGLTQQELAFIAGRHLAYFRPEHYALVFFPTVIDLSTLFLATIKITLPEVPVPTSLSERVGKMRKELARHVGDDERARLTDAVKALEARGGRVDLAAWVRSVELSAGRAGLVLCGDLGVAMKRIRSEARAVGELSAEDRRNDLLAFSASSELAALREKLGVAARPSLNPPAMTAEAAG
jgi:tetratricopeptide (TPR) repeat protein